MKDHESELIKAAERQKAEEAIALIADRVAMYHRALTANGFNRAEALQLARGYQDSLLNRPKKEEAS